MTKKLLLINPANEDNITMAIAGISFPPPALAYLAALTPSDWDISIIDENIEPLTLDDADLVGITALTSNAPRAYKISEQYREKGIKTVMGGIHASMLYEEAIRFVDSVVIGEAESVWQHLIQDFEKNELKRFYRGERTSLENLPKPRNDLYSDKYKIKASVQTARGCPMDCEFCSVTAFHGRTYRQRPVEEVLDELEALNYRDFFFSDDNIMNYGEKAEQRAIQLFRGMVERGLNKRWASQVGIDFANNPGVLTYAKKAGCLAVSIGFESINEETLEEMHKVRNLEVGVRKYREVIKKIQDHGMRVLGGFILGGDGDKKDIFQRTTEFILDSKLDAHQITFLTPLPGTRLYRRLEQEGRLLRTNYPDDWSHYDMGEAVFRPKHMTPDDLEEGVYQVYKHTTSRATSLRRAFNTFIQTKNLPVTVTAYSTNRGYHSIATRKHQYVRNAAPPYSIKVYVLDKIQKNRDCDDMAKKLLLINPSDEAKLNAISVRPFTYAPPSLAYLAALTPSDWDIKIIDENIEPITFEDADLVGITAMTWNAPRAYEISEQYRRKGLKTVMGGIHASMLHDEAIQFVDSVVIGEAESVWKGLLHDFEKNELKKFYRGERISLENLVRPRNDLYSDRYRLKASVQTARGCAMDCEFCSVTTFHGRTYRQRPVEEVLDEIQVLNCKEFFFSDDNILNYGEKAEQRAIQLFRGMVERGLNKRWASQVGIDFASNPEVLRWAQKSGCLTVHIGFESVVEETLEGMHKVRNLKVGVKNYKEVIKRIHDHGIGVHGAFILGSDGDRKDVFQRTIEFSLNSKIDSASFTILTPLPGTRLYDRLRAEGRLLRTNYPADWKHYDFEEPVFRPKHMTPDELGEGAYQVYKHTTSRVKSLKRAFNSLVQTKSLPLTAIAYSLNRGLGSLATSKYQYVKDAWPSGLSDSARSYPATDRGGGEAEFAEGSQESPTPSAKV